MRWQDLEIKDWAPLEMEDVLKTPSAVRALLCAMGLPVRVYKDNILAVEESGFLEGIKQNNQVELIIRSIGGPREVAIDETRTLFIPVLA